MTESEKDQEVTRLRERCALLDSLLGECLRHRYYDDCLDSRGPLVKAKRNAPVATGYRFILVLALYFHPKRTRSEWQLLKSATLKKLITGFTDR
jgi:hypothetical protein